MELSGIVTKVGDTEVISEKFKKRVLWIETDGEYPQEYEIQFNQDNTSKLDGVTLGNTVLVPINLKGRRWTPNDDREPRVFNTLEGWKIEIQGGKEIENNDVQEKVEDDLPF